MEGSLKEQVELIRQVFGYVDHFKEKIFVINLDSEIILHPFFQILVKDLVLLKRMGIRVILIPGAKKRIDDILTKYQIPWQYREGIRITSEDAMPFVKMAAFDVSNVLMTMLAENKADAVIGNWVRARSIGVRHGVDFQCAGQVDKLKTDIIRSVLNQDLIPILPNIGWNARGKPYSISSIELASVLSHELSAEKLFFVTGPKYINASSYRLPDRFDSREDGSVSRMKVKEARDFLKLNLSLKEDPLLDLVERACISCEAGVKRVHIIDGSVEGVLLKEIFSSRGFGIMIYSDEHANIRPMVYEDIPEVLRLMNPLVKREVLIPRTSGMLEDECDDFVVYEVDGILHACGALHIYPEKKGEIAAIAVDETYAGMGLGSKIVSFLLARAEQKGLEQVFALTTQTFDWFLQIGFYQGDKNQLPNKKLLEYDNSRRSVILYFDLPAKRGV